MEQHLPSHEGDFEGGHKSCTDVVVRDREDQAILSAAILVFSVEDEPELMIWRVNGSCHGDHWWAWEFLRCWNNGFRKRKEERPYDSSSFHRMRFLLLLRKVMIRQLLMTGWAGERESWRRGSYCDKRKREEAAKCDVKSIMFLRHILDHDESC